MAMKAKATRRYKKETPSKEGFDFWKYYRDPSYRIVVRTNGNPRRRNSQGFHSFELYRNGMTVQEYIAASYDKETRFPNGNVFNGPSKNHFEYDLNKGFIEMVIRAPEEVELTRLPETVPALSSFEEVAIENENYSSNTDFFVSNSLRNVLAEIFKLKPQQIVSCELQIKIDDGLVTIKI